MYEILEKMAKEQPALFLVAKRGAYSRKYPELTQIARSILAQQ